MFGKIEDSVLNIMCYLVCSCLIWVFFVKFKGVLCDRRVFGELGGWVSVYWNR